MTRSRARSIVATLLNSRTFAVVFRRKVRLDSSPSHGFGADRTFYHPCSTVWGVIWLIIAFVFFAAGVIVGLLAFKVCAYHHREFGTQPRRQDSTDVQREKSETFLPSPIDM